MNRALVVGAVALMMAACADGESKDQIQAHAAASKSSVNLLTIKTRDFVFYDMPDTILAGAT